MEGIWKNRTSSQLFKLDFVKGIKYLKGLHLLRKNTKKTHKKQQQQQKKKNKKRQVFHK